MVWTSHTWEDSQSILYLPIYQTSTQEKLPADAGWTGTINRQSCLHSCHLLDHVGTLEVQNWQYWHVEKSKYVRSTQDSKCQSTMTMGKRMQITLTITGACPGLHLRAAFPELTVITER